MISPPPLKKGDKIAIAAPARKITYDELAYGINVIENAGFEVMFEEDLFDTFNQFAGDDEHRTELMQKYLNDSSVKAILFARGGYGSVRIVDQLDFSELKKNPKWLAGYSDMTVFLNHVNRCCDIETLHAPMPFGFKDNTPESIQSFFSALRGKAETIGWQAHPLNRGGNATGQLVGGNLSVLYSLLGSPTFPKTEGSILFIEDLDEYLYHIDRMMMGLKRAGKLHNLSGMVVGGMTDMRDNAVPFGKTAEEIVWDAVRNYDFPVAFGCPVGHISDNRTLVMGQEMRLEIAKTTVTLFQ